MVMGPTPPGTGVIMRARVRICHPSCSIVSSTSYNDDFMLLDIRDGSSTPRTRPGTRSTK